MLLNVVESVLRDVSDAQIRGLPNRSISWALLGGADLDGRRLASVVRADNCNTVTCVTVRVTFMSMDLSFV